MPGLDFNLLGDVSRALPAAVADGGSSPGARPRFLRYRELAAQPLILTEHALADEGAYFCANSFGTTIATAAGGPTSLADTTPLMVMKNNALPASGIRLYLRSIKILQIGGTAPASTTSVQYAFSTDSGNRVPTAGTSTITGVGVNQDSGTLPNGVLYVPNAANPTAPAAVSKRNVARGQVKGAATAVLDEYNFIFGSLVDVGTVVSAGITRYSQNVPPLVIGPQQFGLFHLYFPSGATNAFTFEYEVTWFER